MSAKRKLRNGGRKPKTQEEEIARALNQALPTKDVVDKLAEAVKRRESWAVTLWFGYLWGKPIERQELTGAGGAAIVLSWDNGDDEPEDTIQAPPETA